MDIYSKIKKSKTQDFLKAKIFDGVSYNSFYEILHKNIWVEEQNSFSIIEEYIPMLIQNYKKKDIDLLGLEQQIFISYLLFLIDNIDKNYNFTENIYIKSLEMLLIGFINEHEILKEKSILLQNLDFGIVDKEKPSIYFCAMPWFFKKPIEELAQNKLNIEELTEILFKDKKFSFLYYFKEHSTLDFPIYNLYYIFGFFNKVEYFDALRKEEDFSLSLKKPFEAECFYAYIGAFKQENYEFLVYLKDKGCVFDWEWISKSLVKEIKHQKKLALVLEHKNIQYFKI